MTGASDFISGVTGVILAGGASRRMGSNKALLPYRGGRFIEAIHRQLSELFTEVIAVTDNPQQYAFLPCRKVPDLYPGMGALAGIHAGLSASTTPAAFVVGCDMPYLNPALIRHLARYSDNRTIVMPYSHHGPEPLHAFYGRGTLDVMTATLGAGRRRIAAIFDAAPLRPVLPAEILPFDPLLRSFSNINTPEDYFSLRCAEGGVGRGEDEDARGTSFEPTAKSCPGLHLRKFSR